MSDNANKCNLKYWDIRDVRVGPAGPANAGPIFSHFSELYITK